jgi:hypothetical protein
VRNNPKLNNMWEIIQNQIICENYS